MNDKEKVAIREKFEAAVNLTPTTLEKWLDTEDSKRVGWKGSDGKGSGESVGHHSGRRIIAIKRTKHAELSADDYDHMKKVVSYVARHNAQGPKEDKEHSDWRYSLMNWEHDPLKG